MLKMIAEPGVAEAVGMLVPVLAPQQPAANAGARAFLLKIEHGRQ